MVGDGVGETVGVGVDDGKRVRVGVGDTAGVEVRVGGSVGVGVGTVFGLKATTAPLHVTDLL